MTRGSRARSGESVTGNLTTNTSFELCRETSIYPRHYLLKRSDELLPPALGILLGLLLIFEVVEPALPEPGHLACPVDQGGKRAELRPIMGLASFMAVAYQPGPLQNAEML